MRTPGELRTLADENDKVLENSDIDIFNWKQSYE